MPFSIDSDCGTVTYHFIWRHDVPVLLKTVRRELNPRHAKERVA